MLEDGDDQETQVFLSALSSFYQYSKVAHFNTTHLRRQSFYALPRSHIELLSSPPFSYLDTLEEVDNAIDKNAEIAQAILTSGLQSPDLDSEVSLKAKAEGKDWRGLATSNDIERARSTMRQLFRDWSEEGKPEREACYRPVFDALAIEKSRHPEAKLRVLVPGAGLGRLVFDLCCAGFDSEGNEISYTQLLTSSYILNSCSEARIHTLFPWIHSFSNHRTRSNHLRSVQIPDINPRQVLGSSKDAGRMSMSASDFLLLYGSEEQQGSFDAIATVFFLDTAPNVIRYLEVIRNCLKPDGLLINVGPLLWHFEGNAPGIHGKEKDMDVDMDCTGIAEPGSFELTEDELIVLVERMGFTIERRDSNINAPYIHDKESMLQNTYMASSWVARKI
ncbi:N2227-like protein-domain-containing protein [Amylocarpus encephaloides]|uniref:carnosine N-methyltransferase n=1 Tax=Amylocarpus encephaloides TaxID=45428 RepID=A0A9P7YNC8_9HELO|nr:N2227-like protein-domain-containing protein [Amylocarpus encephaloides]